MKQRKRIGELMVEVGLITPAQLQHALAVQAKHKGRLGDVLLSEGLITEEQLIEVLDYQLGIPHVQLYRHHIEQEIIDLISQRLAEQYRVLPLRIEDSKLIAAMEDPLDYYALEELRLATGYRIEPVIATREELGRMIRRYYGMQESVDEMLQHLQQYEEETLSAQLEDEQSPVVRTVNQLITQAVTVRASDIHLDPHGEEPGDSLSGRRGAAHRANASEAYAECDCGTNQNFGRPECDRAPTAPGRPLRMAACS